MYRPIELAAFEWRIWLCTVYQGTAVDGMLRLNYKFLDIEKVEGFNVYTGER